MSTRCAHGQAYDAYNRYRPGSGGPRRSVKRFGCLTQRPSRTWSMQPVEHGSGRISGMAKFVVTPSSEKQRAAWTGGGIPEVEQVRPGLWSIPVPIPVSPLRYVLVYALELDGGVAIVDAGWNTDEAYDALTAGLGVAGHTIADVRAVLVTHIHPDHYGLAGRVREASGAWIGLHPADARLLRDRYDEAYIDGLVARERAQLLRCG